MFSDRKERPFYGALDAPRRTVMPVVSMAWSEDREFHVYEPRHLVIDAPEFRDEQGYSSMSRDSRGCEHARLCNEQEVLCRKPFSSP